MLQVLFLVLVSTAILSSCKPPSEKLSKRSLARGKTKLSDSNSKDGEVVKVTAVEVDTEKSDKIRAKERAEEERTRAENSAFQDCAAKPDAKMTVSIYKLPPNTNAVPDFAALTPVKKMCMEQLEIDGEETGYGLPGIPLLAAWIGLDIRFKVTVPTAGKYSFELNSGDGSNLYVNDAKVITNDGVHPPKSVQGAAELKAGVNTLRVTYFLATARKITLDLKWTSPGEPEYDYIPDTVISRP